MLDWLSQNWGNLASVAGLLFTLYVLVVSKRAEEAAKEAKRAVERKSVAQELQSCSDDLNFINLLCDNKKWEIASFICNRLIQSLTFITNRWTLHFKDDAQKNLNLLITQLDTLNAQLRKFTNRQPQNRELESLAAAILRINTVLAAEVGKYESQVND